MSNISEVIGWKHNNMEGMSTKDGVIVAFPGGIPSQADQDALSAEFKVHLVAVAFEDDRRKAYGDIGDQLDMQYWDQVNDTTTFKDHVAAVKAAHPKP